MDGIISDDSDCFLFGARRVYRHFFRRECGPECYDAGLIETELGLNRDRLIWLALFLGSDYTLGVKGVGIVNALEIVSTF